MKRWIIISYYTIDTDYEKEALKLEESLKKFNLPYRFFAKKPIGSWRANLNFKSEIILEAFKRYPRKDIVFIDADGIVRQYPALFDELSKNKGWDIAAHFYHYRQSIPGGSLLSGTLWFKNGANTKKLVKRWHEIGLENPDIRHQHCLNLAINEFWMERKPLKVFKLPQGYTHIFDNFRYNKEKAVIEHFQVSRKLRRKVGWGKELLDSSFMSLQDKGKIIRPISIPQKTDSKYRTYRVVRTSDLRSDLHLKKRIT